MLIENFTDLASNLMRRIFVSEKEIEVLSELRDTLLPKLISGELHIPDAEKFLEEAGI
jgi:type I restriction enzyme S subunit